MCEPANLAKKLDIFLVRIWFGRLETSFWMFPFLCSILVVRVVAPHAQEVYDIIS
jgi:hypothetical protein